jgi:RNA polymerase sigma-70 factor (sigma-E family)
MPSRRDAEFTEYAQARLSWLRSLAFVLCQDWQRADDLVQEALTRLYARWGKVRLVDNPDGYARVTLVREYLRERSSPWARRVVLAHDPPDSAVSSDAGGADVGLREELSRLPAGQRTVLVLRFYCDLSVDQAAQVLGCSPGTVKSQTAKGLMALRRSLDPDPPGEPAAGRSPSLEGTGHG